MIAGDNAVLDSAFWPCQLRDGERTWTVVGADHLPVGPIVVLLEHYRSTGRRRTPSVVRPHAAAEVGGGNACLTCDHFATDAGHVDDLREQFAATEALIGSRRQQHRDRTGHLMSDDHIWLVDAAVSKTPSGSSSTRWTVNLAASPRGAAA